MPNWKHIFAPILATAVLFPSAAMCAPETSATAIIESLGGEPKAEEKVEVPDGYYNPDGKSAKQKILGIERERWEKDLAGIMKNPFERKFLDSILSYEKALKKKRSADKFEYLNGERRTKKDNPFHVYGSRTRTRYIVDMSLSKTDYAKVIDFLPEMQKFMDDEAAERYLPYIALCCSEGMKFSDIRFYVRRDAFMGSPVDIALERLYRELKIFTGEL